MSHRSFLLGLLTLVATWPASAFAQKQPAADGLDVVYLRAGGPILLRLQFQVAGKSIDEQWQAYVGKVFRYVDRDGNGSLDAKELALTPKANLMVQLFRQGNFFVTPATTLTLAELGKKPEDRVELADLLRHYRNAGAGPVQIFANNQFVDQVSKVLFDILDTDKDGKLSSQELKNAWTVLAKLDTDDDETVSAQELSPVFNPAFGRPGFNSTGNQNTTFYTLTPTAPRAPLVALLLAKYDANKNGRLNRKEIAIEEVAFQALDLNQDGELDAEELGHWADRSPDYLWDVRMGKAGAETAWTLKKRGTELGQSVLALDDVEISLKAAPGNVAGFRNNVAAFYQQQFAQADTGKRGYLQLADVQQPQFQFLRNSFALMDQNNDGKLTPKEMQAFFDLQTEALSAQVSVSLAEQGRTLFQLLDANRDGRLSQRELRSAWKRLQLLDRDHDDAIGPDEIPRQVQIAFGQGPQVFNLQNLLSSGVGQVNPGMRPISSRGPVWFRKMDVNGDGDVSRREFLGTREEFLRIDADGDGLIDVQEAEAADRALRKR